MVNIPGIKPTDNGYSSVRRNRRTHSVERPHDRQHNEGQKERRMNRDRRRKQVRIMFDRRKNMDRRLQKSAGQQQDDRASSQTGQHINTTA